MKFTYDHLIEVCASLPTYNKILLIDIGQIVLIFYSALHVTIGDHYDNQISIIGKKDKPS